MKTETNTRFKLVTNVFGMFLKLHKVVHRSGTLF